MPRSNRPRRQGGNARDGKWAQSSDSGGPPLERTRFGVPELQDAPDGQWHVRRVSPVRAEKTYSCPGCRVRIAPGTDHVVAWRADDLFGDERAAAERRHWHTRCWDTRSHRYR